MRFDAPVLLYGAGHEARSTASFIKSRSPGTKLFVTVDSGAADIPDAEFIAPADLPQAIEARRFGTIVKSPGVSRYRPVFAMAREDVFPAGDVALQASAADLKGLEARPGPAALRLLAEVWAPHRSLAARLLWHHWRFRTGRPSMDDALLAVP